MKATIKHDVNIHFDRTQHAQTNYRRTSRLRALPAFTSPSSTLTRAYTRPTRYTMAYIIYSKREYELCQREHKRQIYLILLATKWFFLY